jgi:hypothetical protein
MLKLDTLFLYLFVLSTIFLFNIILKIVTSILSNTPKQIQYSKWEMVSNYFFISYLITYLIINLI